MPMPTKRFDLERERPRRCKCRTSIDLQDSHVARLPNGQRAKTVSFRFARQQVKAPVLVVHGENDAVVPITLGKQLYDLISAPKRFVRIAGAGHNDLGAEAVAAAKQFIAGRGLFAALSKERLVPCVTLLSGEQV
jgi:pimeloyl-ACP methyl ester carboxylesterase